MRHARYAVFFAAVVLFVGCVDANTEVYTPVVADVVAAEPEQPDEDVPPEPNEVPALEVELTPQNVTAVSVGSWHTLAVTEGGTLWVWGGIAQSWTDVILGDGTIEQRLTPVPIMEDVVFAVAGETHSQAITSDGTLWACAYVLLSV